MPRRFATVALITILLPVAGLSIAAGRASQTAPAQTTQSPQSPQSQTPPWKAKNLEFFPKDISRQELTQRMREFSLALGVRCQHCHVGGDGISFDGVVFDSDEKPAKRKARVMLRMVDQINTVTLAQLPSRAEPRVVVECATCHHGLAIPKSLQTTLFEIIQTQGTAAAVAKYRELRADAALGRYNFGIWEINELARRLSQVGKSQEAIAMLEMNGEFYPDAPEIDVFIGQQYEKLGDNEKALQRYRAALAKAPQNEMIKQHLAAFEKSLATGAEKTPPE
jgi:tetratricopeptide (TPR) repeat protein